MARRRTPQEKKRLSYERDRRNCYGNNDKAARVAVPRRKREVNRRYRRGVTAAIASTDPSVMDVTVKAVKRPRWRKQADTPLGEVVRFQRRRRTSVAGPISASTRTQKK
jgi:hypothetical protein